MEPLFDYEKLDVYRVELAFIAWIADFLGDVAQSSVQCRRELIEQLDRASLSVLLNTAEGNGKRQGRQRAKFFDDARGSAFECAACLDASVAKRFASVDRVRPGKEMLARVVAMLTRLIDRFDIDDTRNCGCLARLLLPRIVLVLSLFSSSTSSHASGSDPVGSIDYGFFDHQTAHTKGDQKTRTRTTTRTRTIREAEEAGRKATP